jgi:glycosidase
MMKKPWWHNAVVYQIYPRSFKDSNANGRKADGCGDIPGIIEKLDYLADLGINAIWLCPVCSSPMADNGYDISNYQDINPQFGTLADMERLIAEADKRGIKILLDLVLNHSSAQHEWFKKAKAAVLAGDTQNPYREYYYFRKGKDGGAEQELVPPNNWRSYFGGSVWERVDNTDYYYLHLFAKEQPDLNWENPALRQELYSMIRWWIDKGIAGFRIDAICNIKKDLRFADLPVDGKDNLANGFPSFLMYPGIEAFLGEMRDTVFKPAGVFTVAEAAGVKPEKLDDFIGRNGYFSTIFDFSYTDIDLTPGCPYYKRHFFTHRELRDTIFANQTTVQKYGYGAPYLENHDQNRSPNKYLAESERTFEGKTLLGILFFFLQGIPFIYQGQELGMTNHPWKSMDEFDDLSARDMYDRLLLAGHGEQEAFELTAHRSRDNSRTPMLWDDSPNAGFSTAKPWLPVHPDFSRLNAAAQTKDSDSVLNFYKKMIQLRKEHGALFMHGIIKPCFLENGEIIAYKRVYRGNGDNAKGEQALVLCNFANTEQTVTMPKGHVWLGNIRGQGTALQGKVVLSPLEALVCCTG